MRDSISERSSIQTGSSNIHRTEFGLPKQNKMSPEFRDTWFRLRVTLAGVPKGLYQIEKAGPLKFKFTIGSSFYFLDKCALWFGTPIQPPSLKILKREEQLHLKRLKAIGYKPESAKMEFNHDLIRALTEAEQCF